MLRKQLTLLLLVCSLFFMQYKYLEFKFGELEPLCPVSPDSLQFDSSPIEPNLDIPMGEGTTTAYFALYELSEGERTYQSEYPRLIL